MFKNKNFFKIIWEWIKKYLFRINSKPEKDFNKIAFPIVRRVFPSLIADEIVSVQPMKSPSGNMFFMNYKSHFGPMPKLGEI